MSIIISSSTTAKEIAAVCTTTTAAKGYYKDLIAAGLDKAKAKDLIAAAVELVKANQDKAKAAAAVVSNEVSAARAWYRDGSKVMHQVFIGFIKSAEFKAAAKGLKFKGSEVDFINRFYPNVTSAGRPVKRNKVEINGVVFNRWTFIDTSRPGAYQAIFDACLNGVKRSRLDQFKQRRGK